MTDRLTALRELRESVATGTATDISFICLTPVEHARAYGAYRGSLDAALALHEALLPGWHYMIEDCRPDDGAAVQLGSAVSIDTGIEGDMPIARAWLLALLDALIRQNGDGNA
jgi:hypothetical protein